MSKTTDWVIALEEEARATGKMTLDHEWDVTEEEFHKACDAIEASLDTFLDKHGDNNGND